MSKTKKLFSIILSLTMILSCVNVFVPMSASAEATVSNSYDGSIELILANNDDEAKVDGEYGIGMIGGKSAADVCNWFAVKNGATLPNGGGCYLPCPSWDKNGLGKRAVIAFDVLFDSEDANIHFAANTYDDEEMNVSSRNSFVTISPAEGITRYTEDAGLISIPETAPTSFLCGRWYNVAVEIACNGTNAVNIYVNGVRYECNADVDIYGLYRFRANIVKGSMYIDNYRCVIGEQEDDLYAEEDYQVADISLADSDKVSFNSQTGEFKLLGAISVAELKELIIAEGCNVEIFKTAELKNVLTDADAVSAANCIVVSNDAGAFRYYGFEHINDSDFEIEALADGIGCRVLGYKAGVEYDTTAITIPEYIAGYIVKEIGASAFANLKIGEGPLTLPDTVEVIGNDAFYDAYCTVSAWPKNLKVIGDNAFVHAVISAGEMPKGLKSIGFQTFKFTKMRANPIFNDGLETIGDKAYEQTEISKMIMPDSVTSFGRYVIKACESLNTLRFPRNSTVTAIPTWFFSAAKANNDSYLFGDMEIYIPETITTIPDHFLWAFKDGAKVTIYGEVGSAAHDFYKATKAALEAGTYTNEATYGSEGAYTDADGDGKGELGELIFVDYNFDYDCANVINETGINKGDTTPGELWGTVNDPIFQGGVAGVGGKLANDLVIELTSTGGNGGQNYINTSGRDPRFVREISICVPNEGSADANFGYYNESGSYNTAIAWSVSKDGIYVLEEKVADANAGEWVNMAIVVDNGGSNKVCIYVNGTPYKRELAGASYGIRHFRDYTTANPTAYTVYYDNIRNYNEGDITYNVMADAPAQVSAASDKISINNKTILFNEEDAQYTVSEFIKMLSVNESANAALRVYTDRTFTTKLEDNEVIGYDAVLVVAAKNGYSFERTYSYYKVNPETNRTIYDFAVLSEADKTAAVTGFLEENITEVDDLSAIKIPETIMGYTITEIAANAFKEDPVVQSVVIPDTVTKIGEFAFAGTSVSGRTTGVITDVKLSKNLKEIGRYAFACNGKLSEIEFPDGLETIGGNAFYWTGLKAVSIPDSVTAMGGSVFRLCSDLKYVKLSSGVATVNGQAFYGGAVNIKDIVIPETVTSITEDVFANYEMDTTVYGVAGSYAQEWADKYGFKFVGVVANTIAAAPKILGDGEKEIHGTDFDLAYGFKTLEFDGKLTNIGKEDVSVLVIIALYDDSGYMVTADRETVPIPAGKSVDLLADYDISISAKDIKDDYTVKGFIWRAGNIEPIADETAVVFDADKQEVHALLIGNSFGNDSFAYLNDIATADGVIIKAQNMYIGGATLNEHYTNMSGNVTKYQPVIDGVYGASLTTMESGLKSDKWNVVALQCGTHGFSKDYDFLDYAKEGSNSEMMYAYIKNYVETYAPTAQKVMHMSWGPCDEQAREMYEGRFSDETLYPDASRAVFEAQEAAYKYGSTIFADAENMMVPSSYAIWYAIDELGYEEHSGERSATNTYPNPVAGEVSMFRDETCHLTDGIYPYGRVLAGLTWYEYLTGNDVRENPYQISGISEEVMANLKAAAHWANTQVEPLK